MTKLDEFINRLDSITEGAREGFNEVQDAMDGPTLRHDSAPDRLDYPDDADYYEACLVAAREQLQGATGRLMEQADALDAAAGEYPAPWNIKPGAREAVDDELAGVLETIEEVTRWRGEIERFEAAYRDETDDRR